MNIRHFDLKRHSNAEKGYRISIHTAADPMDWHDHEYYEFVLSDSSKLIHHVNGGMQELTRGALVFIRKNDTHKFGKQSSSLSYTNFNFSEQIFEKLFDFLENDSLKQRLLSPKMPPYVVLAENEYRHLTERLKRVALYQNEVNEDNEMLMRQTLLEIIMSHFGDYDFDGDALRMPYWLKYTCRQMKKLSNFSAGLPKMIEISGKSVDYLGKCTKKYLGMRPTQYINSLRLRYIATMLINSDCSITDLGYESGFQSIAYFYKLFMEEYGVSPKEYRKIHTSG